MNTNSPPLVVGLVWYDAEDYPAIQALMKDAHLLPPTYERWKLLAEQGEDVARRAGRRVVRITLKPDAFRQFCLRHGLDVDAHGRNQFAAFGAKQAHVDGRV